MDYTFSRRDMDQAFEFAVQYYLDPKKPPSGRTNAEPRGLGATLDAFTRGKLVEIGVQKMLEKLNSAKEYLLDFEIKDAREVVEAPDIVGIRECGQKRDPRLFIEIKNTSEGDRWIGLTKEQMDTIVATAGGNRVYLIYTLLRSKAESSKKGDPVGMYLKSIASASIFHDFADLDLSAELKLILSIDELSKYGMEFPAGGLFYETDIFEETNIYTAGRELKKGIELVEKHRNFNGTMNIRGVDGALDRTCSPFNICGSFIVYQKKNEKSRRDYIECLDDTVVKNEVFGEFQLRKGKSYSFNLFTVGRDPRLKRNNVWISKRRAGELIKSGAIMDPDRYLKQVADGL
jgi:hypothetical protein